MLRTAQLSDQQLTVEKNSSIVSPHHVELYNV